MKIKYLKYLKYFSFTLVIWIGTNSFLFGQAKTDSVLMENSKTAAKDYFKNFVNENALIYAGNEYVEYISLEMLHKTINGTPFFITDSLLDGNVDFDGTVYNLPIKFQLLNQKLVLNHPVTNTPIELQNEHVNGFNIGTHHFYKIPNELNKILPSKQIYAEQYLFDHFEVWVLHDKILKLAKHAEDQSAMYINVDQYAIKRNGKWGKLRSEKEVMDFCQDKKIQTQAYIYDKNLDFKVDFEYAILQLFKYYDSISN
jgi:hypothetical protein